MAWEKLKDSANQSTPDVGAPSEAMPSLDVDSLGAKKKPGSKKKLVNPVPGFNK
jgi:hypothetical protein